MAVLLIASGDVEFGEFYRSYFAETDNRIIQTCTQKETLTYLENAEMPLSMVLIEMPLPDEPGGRIVRYMRNHPVHQYTNIISLMEERVSAMIRPRLGIEHVLYKPLSLSELGEYMSNLILIEAQMMPR